MHVNLDTVTEAVVWLLELNGYTVRVEQDGETYHATATHATEPQHKASGDDPHKVVCELAEHCGIELEDG